MLISRVLHAGYLFEDEARTRILFDPVLQTPFSVNCHAFPEIQFDYHQLAKENFDAVFISHLHEDHFSLESLARIDRATPIYFYCVQADPFAQLRGLGFQSVSRLEIDVPVALGQFLITPRRALEPEVDCLFQIQLGQLNILNVVDSWIDPDTLPQLRQLGPWDMILWPFQTMREVAVLAPSRSVPENPEVPQEWIEQLRLLMPRVLVPSSCQFQQEPWSWYNRAMFPVTYRFFAEEIGRAKLPIEILRLNPGRSVKLSANGYENRKSISWITPVGDQDVDYVYDPDFAPPATSEVAAHFSELPRLKSEFVYEFCRSKLPNRFACLEISEEAFFERPRHWRLSVFNSRRRRIDFDYRINRGEMKLLREGATTIHWQTEISTFKLYSALKAGESLTSLYLRINDIVFDEQTEKDLVGTDLLQDPLIRVLSSLQIFTADQ